MGSGIGIIRYVLVFIVDLPTYNMWVVAIPLGHLLYDLPSEIAIGLVRPIKLLTVAVLVSTTIVFDT